MKTGIVSYSEIKKLKDHLEIQRYEMEITLKAIQGALEKIVEIQNIVNDIDVEESK